MRELGRRATRADSRFLLRDFEPVYLETWRRGLLPGKREAALAELARCQACPRGCRIDRLADQRRVCHTGRHAIVSSAFPHFGEESPSRAAWASRSSTTPAPSTRSPRCG